MERSAVVDVSTKEPLPSLSSVAVLVVDDDHDTRELFHLILEDAGYTVYEAPDGMSALKRLRTHPDPLIVLLDWWMPGMDGLSVLHALVAGDPATQPHVFIVLTAAYEALEQHLSHDLTALPSGLTVTVAGKPIHLDTLVSLVDHAAAGVCART